MKHLNGKTLTNNGQLMTLNIMGKTYKSYTWETITIKDGFIYIKESTYGDIDKTVHIDTIEELRIGEAQ